MDIKKIGQAIKKAFGFNEKPDKENSIQNKHKKTAYYNYNNTVVNRWFGGEKNFGELGLAVNYKPMYIMYDKSNEVLYFSSIEDFLLNKDYNNIFSDKNITEVKPYTLLVIHKDSKEIKSFDLYKPKPEKQKHALVLASSGLDCTVAASWAKNEGYNFFVGVPCSHLKDLINDIQKDKLHQYIPVTREDIAMGVASGAYMAGKKPVVFLQNSGLGHLVNIITSLLVPYDFRIHLVISVRTKPFEHEFMAKITKKLIKLLNYEDHITLVE